MGGKLSIESWLLNFIPFSFDIVEFQYKSNAIVIMSMEMADVIVAFIIFTKLLYVYHSVERPEKYTDTIDCGSRPLS